MATMTSFQLGKCSAAQGRIYSKPGPVQKKMLEPQRP